MELFFRESIKGRDGQIQHAARHIPIGVRDPIGDIEGADFGEVTVIEHQQEIASPGS